MMRIGSSLNNQHFHAILVDREECLGVLTKGHYEFNVTFIERFIVFLKGMLTACFVAHNRLSRGWRGNTNHR